MSEPRTIGLGDITGPSAETVQRAAAEIAKTPTEADFKGKPGYYKQYVPGRTNSDGTPYYRWGCAAAANDGHGKLSRHAHEVGEMMRPAWEEAANKPGQLGSFGGRGRGRCVSMIRDGVYYRRLPDGGWVIA
jgi:hypothetical protein